MLRTGFKALRLIQGRCFWSSKVQNSEFDQLAKLDTKWTERWKTVKKDKAAVDFSKVDSKDIFYSLVMFPYPSGKLHMGHLRVYTIADIISRVKKLQGYQVMNPMGWDSFGLPAENAAVERGIDPAIWTKSNIEKMKEQMSKMLADFDWDREVSTCDPEYYKWTQKIFLLLYQNGMAYRENAEINWDPVDKTVLANEQVDAKGRSWRSGAVVEKKNLEQWFIRTTKFAKELNQELKFLENWPDYVKTMQKNWIGESYGADITLKVLITKPGEQNIENDITVFTTRPETLFSVQFIALALDHPLVKELAVKDDDLRAFIEEMKLKDDPLSAEGYRLPIQASIPIDVNGESSENFNIPVFTAPYVLGEYGHGAVMGCPAHDERDYKFWKSHSSSSVINATVSDKKGGKISLPYTKKTGYLSNDGSVPLGKYEGLKIKDGAKAIVNDLIANKAGSSTVKYRLRDWLISRQRYWGAPIPIIHCDSCGEVPIPDEQLPVVLPRIPNVTEAFKKGNPLANHPEFVNTTCPSCGSKAKRDTDTMDTFMDSSWYFFRYTDPKNDKEMFSYEKASKLMPVDIYLGGNEHAILHLLYSRFISKFLNSINAWDGESLKGEPFKTLVTQGMVYGLTYRDKETGRPLKPEEIADAIDPKISYEKMSKSKYNGVDPGEVIEKYGADAIRAAIVFQAPLNSVLTWNEDQVSGVARWLLKMKSLVSTFENNPAHEKADLFEISDIKLEGFPKQEHKKIRVSQDDFDLYKTKMEIVKSVTSAINESYTFNTTISDFMKLTNAILNSKASKEFRLDAYITLLILSAPITPCMAEECYEMLQKLYKTEKWESIFEKKWPEFQQVKETSETFSVMINGKKRLTFKSEKNLSITPKEEIFKLISSLPNAQKWIGKDYKSLMVKKGVIVIVK